MISIIIPVTKGTKDEELKATLESVTGQSLTEINVVLVGDTSIDLSGFADKVSLVKCEGKTAGEMQNIGIENATGEYIHFMLPGDTVLPYAYESICNKFLRYGCDVIKFKCVLKDPDSNKYYADEKLNLKKLRPGDFHREIRFEDPVQTHINKYSFSGIYRTSFLKENNIRFPDLDWSQGSVFFTELLLNDAKMIVSRDRLVVHKMSDLSYEGKHINDALKSLDMMIDLAEDSGREKDAVHEFLKREFFAYKNTLREIGPTNAAKSENLKLIVEALGKRKYRFLPEMLTNWAKDAEKLADTKDLDAKRTPYKLKHKKCANPKVTVVVPTYNQEEYLNQALESLTEQTLEEMEFIVVNDGSTDKCMVIYLEYAEVDKRFTLIDKPNSGYGHSMNVGIDNAHGKYLGILEPDDYVVPEMYRDLYARAERNKCDIVKADFYRFKIAEDGAQVNTYNKLSEENGFYGREINPSEETEVFSFIMNTWSGIYNLEFLNKWEIRHNETPGASYQDNGFWFKTFCRAEKIWFINKPYYMNRRDNPNSSMFSKSKFYCVTEEYKLIREWMEKDPELVRKFDKIYYKKKFGNFMVTYYRIARESKKDYVMHIHEEFKKPYEEGKMDPELMGEGMYKILEEIIKDPEGFADRIKVSIIMPVYNAEDFLVECLDSILIWDEINVECICVDDGSSDRSLEILNEYAAKDPRVKVISQENGGAGAARNNGMQYATGEYMWFVDCDDVFEPETLRTMYNMAHKYDSDVHVFRSNQFYDNPDNSMPMTYTIRRELIPVKEPFAGDDIKQSIFSAFVGWPWDKLFRSEFVRENNLKFQVQRTSNDLLFVFSAIAKAERISTSNAVLGHHRRSAGDSLSVTREKSWRCFYDALCALKDQLTAWGLYDRFEADFVNYSLNFSLWNLNTIVGKVYFELYDKLKDEWWENLGVTSKDEEFFYNLNDYEQYQRIMSMTAEDYLFYRIMTAEAELRKVGNERNRFRDNANRMQKEVNSLKDINKNLKRTADRANAELDELYKSKSYKMINKLRKIIN